MLRQELTGSRTLNTQRSTINQQMNRIYQGRDTEVEILDRKPPSGSTMSCFRMR
jgi:hypothetical protein